MDDQALAATLLPLIGGPGNVTSVTACASRLRLVLRDMSAPDEDAIVALPEVPIVLEQAGQFQIVLGGRSLPVSRAIQSLL